MCHIIRATYQKIFVKICEVMNTENVLARVAENGRISLPSKQRKLLGLEAGGAVVIRLENGELHIRPVRSVIASLQDRVRQHLAGSGETVDRFLADRREEANRENL